MAQLKIAVQAQPVQGRANSALAGFLAEMFDLPRNAVVLKSGALSRTKVFLVQGVSLERAEALLAEWALKR